MEESINTCIDMYSQQISNLLSIIIPKLADGFSIQRGAFGPNAENETDNLLKISNIIGDMKRKLDKAPVHNLSEERSIGFMTSCKVYGVNNKSASKKMIINKGIDILED